MEVGEMNQAIKAAGRDPKAIAQEMIDAILGDRVHDNAGEQNFINHEPEEYAAHLFQAYLDYYKPEKLTAKDIQAFHLIYAHARIMVNARVGKVLLDKVVDTGGWATVMADGAGRHTG